MNYNKNFYHNKYLCEALESYIKEDITSFHMPAHKNNKIISNVPNLLNIDFTEIDGLDNLHNPKDTIKKSQDRISSIYGSKKSYMLVNGSTVGILSAILSQVKENDLILINRDSHKSVLSAIELSKCNYGYLYKEKSKYDNYTDFNYDTLEDTILQYNKTQKVKAICITSPSYEGVICNVKKISKICEKYDIILIVDEAHGAHFNHNEKLLYSSIHNGADIVIQSLHKTMPALTQTSLLHICSNKVNVSAVEKYLAMLQTSSPSYIFMYTIDKLMENIKSIDFKSHNEAIKTFRKTFKSKSNGDISILDEKDFNTPFYDFTRLVIYSKKLRGTELHKILLEKYNFNFEMANLNYVIGITSPFDNFNSYEKLKEALLEIEQNYSTKEVLPIEVYEEPISFNIKKFPSSDEVCLINITDSINKICYENIIPYPPGIPIVCSGDVITENIINNILNNINNKKEVLGVYEHEKIFKIKTIT